jgi:hypothetical protein
MEKAYLSAKCFVVARIEVLGKDSLGKGICGVQDEQPTAPLYYPRILFRLEHIMEAPDELVEP